MSLYDSLVECVQIGTTFLLNLWLRRPLRLHLRRVEHILNENAVPRCRIIDEHVRYRADELAVLDNRATAHECGQEGTTVFYKNFTEISAKNTLSRIF